MFIVSILPFAKFGRKDHREDTPHFIKGCQDPSHFIFEFNVEMGRIRHKTTLNLYKVILNRFEVDLEIQFQRRCMSDPTLSDIDFRDKMAWVWTTLKTDVSRQKNRWSIC